MDLFYDNLGPYKSNLNYPPNERGDPILAPCDNFNSKNCWIGTCIFVSSAISMRYYNIIPETQCGNKIINLHGFEKVLTVEDNNEGLSLISSSKKSSSSLANRFSFESLISILIFNSKTIKITNKSQILTGKIK